MDFTLTDAQRAIAASARHYLADTYPPERLTAIAEGTGIDDGAWPALTRQGWLDPDLGMLELGLLALESGYALHPTPWLTTVAFTRQAVPSTLVDGVEARLDGDQWRLTGQTAPVPDAAGAAVLLVRADRGRAGAGLFTVERGDATLHACAGPDPLRRMYRVDLHQAPGTPVAGDLGAAPDHRPAVLLACEAVGVAARALDVAVAHAKTRTQFGRPIGSFQGVAHRLADAYVELELARSLALRAAWFADQPADPGGLLPALACATLAGREAAVRGCEIAIQVLGGIGVTWEHTLHLWFRRALWLESFAAPAEDPRLLLAETVLEGGAR